MESTGFAQQARALVTNVEELLDDPHARSRVRGIHHLVLGIKVLEQEVIAEARRNEMSWAAIGEVYGCTRQAAQQRFGGS